MKATISVGKLGIRLAAIFYWAAWLPLSARTPQSAVFGFRMDHKVRVLLVEDHEITRVGLRVALSGSGDIEIVGECADGEKAITLAHELAPSVVLMDIGLPIKSGVEATKEIKARTPQIRILMLTLHDSDDDVRAAFGAGADGYCLKDIPTPTLALAISSIAAGAVWLDPRIAKTFLQFNQPRGKYQFKIEGEGKGEDNQEAELTPRELEVLELLAQGLSNNEIAEKLFVSAQTVKTHVRHIMEKMAVSDRTQAAVRAIKKGLV
jgi:DNA-binding NarL/FixJ family response regulator